MAHLNEIVEFLDDTLAISSIPDDKSNNGLQIQGGDSVTTVIGAVDGCLQTYEAAAERGADLIFVHHGESWGDSLKRLTGHTAERLRVLFKRDISLYAAHLPLDAHSELGHNARIANTLGLREQSTFAEYAGAEIGIRGEIDAVSVDDLAALVDEQLSTQSVVYNFGSREIHSVGVISGAGAGAIPECPRLGIDCLITGEFGHTDYHVIRELGDVAVIAAGHYKTEVPGVIAVLDLLKKQFDVTCEFVDSPTGL